MSFETYLVWWIIAIMSMLLFATFAISSLIASAACGDRWEPRKSEYGIIAGCRVMTKSGWMPEDNVRSVE